MNPQLQTILSETAAKHGVNPAFILTPYRWRKLAHARHEAMYRARMELGLSYPKLGVLFARDHSTCLHGVRAHELRDTRAFRAMNLRMFAGAL